ncbi:hypothetical protein BDK51DRAFT_32407 [Blyttiomyces helicus]|uniref:Uncharacterized protein n=1 Tax=Blyttiomyces helicus TaxID=388810 RepID=A0A4P9WFS4_9FUNG|nr:hypothetical protein BDK51DRAFT_32407 [Blyttiomyces helicus]|eukprot:RKO90178.1 hypothetical protein BDK51DRAFT_32407 [Blyttiomyces helicus]
MTGYIIAEKDNSFDPMGEPIKGMRILVSTGEELMNISKDVKDKLEIFTSYENRHDLPEDERIVDIYRYACVSNNIHDILRRKRIIKSDGADIFKYLTIIEHVTRKNSTGY